MSELVEAFTGIDTEAFPDVHALSERLQMFWVLHVGAERAGVAVLTPAEISTICRDAFGIALSRQRVEGTLAAERGTVATRKSAGRRAYQLMATGRNALLGATTGAHYIDPATGYTGLRGTHALLGEFRGEVSVCDPYVDHKTLDALAECRAAGSLRLLTHNVRKRDGIAHAARVFAKEHGVPLEVRIAPPGVLHDRYAIHASGMVVFGTSLNSLGLKQSFVVAVGNDIRATVLRAYGDLWGAAAAL